MTSAPSLDFEALLSRDYRPANVTLLKTRDVFQSHVDDHKKIPRERDDEAIEDALRENAETSRLVLSLVTQTSAFTCHLPEEQRQPPQSSLLTQPAVVVSESDDSEVIDPRFHAVELEDWESKIRWDGTDQEKPRKDPMELLKRPRNPFLDCLRFDNSTVSWDGNTDKLLEKARNAPLILELGVAGQSVAKHVYQNTVLSAQRPTPALQSDAYRQRVDRDWNGGGQQQEVNKHSLHTDKEQLEKTIAERQKKRAQMAKDKTNRVLEAMGTLALGGGRGRTITSSLMGPGGTERTGRPTRAADTSAAHDREYVEQLDMLTQHTLVRDLSKVMLREYHRPKLPLAVVRQELPWQFQIRYSKSAATAVGTKENSQSYHSVMMGGAPGTMSKTKLRSENDLSPTEGKLVLMEYFEERPLVQLTKGMAFKIVNYYRGDKSRCPVSAGGGDRPAARRKRIVEETTTTHSVAKRLETSDRGILDWVGKLPKKSKGTEKETVDVLPEGVTEILHPKVHGPFLGEVADGTTVTGLVSNLFVAPMARHEAESTDFLIILTPVSGATLAGQRDSMGVVIRDLPTSTFTVGQTIPRTRVFAPNTQGEKAFVGPFISYQIARALARTQQREGHGLRFDELQDRVMPNLELPTNALRQRLKQVAIYDKNTQIWTSKSIGFEGYPGVEALGKSISPEGIAAFETACSSSRRLSDLGIHQLTERGSHTVMSLGVAMVYLAGQLNAARELSRKMKKLVELSRTNRNVQALQSTYYEKASQELDHCSKALRQRYEVAQFIFEELQLAPWHLTGEFIDVHKKGEGTGMMQLTGLGDPSGQGEGFSFIRQADTKTSKAAGNAALSGQIKKITGTEDDLRKLTMKQMASLLRSYGMAQNKIDTLKRWDRVHVIRDLSTKAASDGIGDGLERFARGEKMKLSEQKQQYHNRIQVIWRRQLAALAEGGTGPSADGAGAGTAGENEIEGEQKPAAKKDNNEDSDEDSDDDDDFAAAFEDEMMDRTEANQLVAEHARGNESGTGGLGQLRAATQDRDMTKDARELAALKRQREEERAAQEGMQSVRASDDGSAGLLGVGRKIIRKRVTKTHPDGRQTTTFKFILQPEEVGKIMAKLMQNPDSGRPRNREMNHEHGIDEKPPGHAMFEDEDDFEYSSKGRMHSGRRGKRRGRGGRNTPRARALQIGKLKTRVSKEERMRKRKREEDELEVYTTTAKRKGTSNRRERGSIRDRRPHVIYAEKLETIRAAVEARPYAGPFVKPVNRRLIPRYYEVISHPIDLQTVRDRISRYEYRSVDTLLRDFELMKNNAIKFNGQASPIAQEAISIYDFVKDKIEGDRTELMELEAAVDEQMGGGSSKGKKRGSKKGSGNTARIGGVSVDLGDLGSSGLQLDDLDSDSDDSFDLGLGS